MNRIAAAAMALFQSPRWSRDELLEFQAARLRALVWHAYRNVPFYRSVFDEAGLDPREIRDIDDLPKIPIATRAQMQDRSPTELVARGLDPHKLVMNTTSGSSGEPLRILRSTFEERVLQAFRHRAAIAHGARILDKHATVLQSRKGNETWVRNLPSASSYARFGFLRTEEIGCAIPPREIVERLKHAQPERITGYPNVLSDAAHLISDEDRELIRPRLVVCGGEVLTPGLRRSIAEGFRARVADFYGAHECNLAGWECPSTGQIHLCEDNAIVEVLHGGRPAQNGETGQVVVTPLHSYAMPLLRFELNDFAVAGEAPCPCGLPYATLKSIEGRAIDTIRLPGGGSIPSTIAYKPLLDHMRWIRKFQMVHERPNLVRVAIVALAEPAAEEMDEARRAVAGAIGPDVSVELTLVESIPPRPNGKSPAFVPCD